MVGHHSQLQLPSFWAFLVGKPWGNPILEPVGRWCEIPRTRPGRASLVRATWHLRAVNKPKMRHWMISAFGGSGSSIFNNIQYSRADLDLIYFDNFWYIVPSGDFMILSNNASNSTEWGFSGLVPTGSDHHLPNEPGSASHLCVICGAMMVFLSWSQRQLPKDSWHAMDLL